MVAKKWIYLYSYYTYKLDYLQGFYAFYLKKYQQILNFVYNNYKNKDNIRVYTKWFDELSRSNTVF